MFPLRLADQRIMLLLDLYHPLPNKYNPMNMNHEAPSYLSPQKNDLVKMNYDGAIKGNPRTTGFGWAFINSSGEILWV